MKLLIVDDNAEMRKLICSLVAEPDDSVFECDRGGMVLEMYSKEYPDYVLMDISMPEMSGIDATKNLIKKFPDAKVLIVSNYGDKELKGEAKNAGAEKYFLKDNLLDVKKYLLQQKKR